MCVWDVQFDKVSKLSKDFEPFRLLWITASDWLRWHDSWMNDPLVDVDAEKVDKNVSESYKTVHKCVKVFSEIPGQRFDSCLIRLTTFISAMLEVYVLQQCLHRGTPTLTLKQNARL